MMTPSEFALLNVLLLIWSSIITGNEGVKIRGIQVPSIVKNGSEPVILECDYTIQTDDPEKDGLVVKWYFKNSANMVYQWIAGMKPQDVGILGGRLNMDYKASDDPAYVHKAIQIATPTTELTGDYKCLVITFETEDWSEMKKMTVYVPEREMILRTPKTGKSDGIVRVLCSAEGVYPEPNMTISSRESLSEQDNVRMNIETRNKDGLYDITATMELNEREDGNLLTFDCILRIPDANYTVHKSIVYYPIRTTTTTTTSTTTPSPSPAPKNQRTKSPGSVFNRTVRTHYLDPDLFREGTLNSSSWHCATTSLTLLAILLISRL